MWDKIVLQTAYNQQPISCVEPTEYKDLESEGLIESRDVDFEKIINLYRNHPVFTHLLKFASKEWIEVFSTIMVRVGMEPYYTLKGMDKEASIVASSVMLSWSMILSTYYYLSDGISSINSYAYNKFDQAHLNTFKSFLPDIAKNENINNSDSQEFFKSLLVHTIESVGISPSTKISKIIDFKKRPENRAMLSKFRTAIDGLSKESLKNSSQQLSPKHHSDFVADTYQTHIFPAIHDLKSSLRDHNIDTIKSTLKTTAFTSGVSVAALGEWALPAAIPINIAVEAIGWHLHRNKLLRENPYSYTVLLEGKFR